jgi:hypothetical protein
MELATGEIKLFDQIHLRIRAYRQLCQAHQSNYLFPTCSHCALGDKLLQDDVGRPRADIFVQFVRSHVGEFVHTACEQDVYTDWVVVSISFLTIGPSVGFPLNQSADTLSIFFRTKPFQVATCIR